MASAGAVAAGSATRSPYVSVAEADVEVACSVPGFGSPCKCTLMVVTCVACAACNLRRLGRGTCRTLGCRMTRNALGPDVAESDSDGGCCPCAGIDEFYVSVCVTECVTGVCVACFLFCRFAIQAKSRRT